MPVVNHLVKKVLFVCWANMDRSPTAEELLRGKAGFESASAGIWEYARRPISMELIDWADHIFVMEEQHRAAILTLRPDAESKVAVLNIPDTYIRNDPELVQLLKTRLSEHLPIDWNT